MSLSGTSPWPRRVRSGVCGAGTSGVGPLTCGWWQGPRAGHGAGAPRGSPRRSPVAQVERLRPQRGPAELQPLRVSPLPSRSRLGLLHPGGVHLPELLGNPPEHPPGQQGEVSPPGCLGGGPSGGTAPRGWGCGGLEEPLWSGCTPTGPSARPPGSQTPRSGHPRCSRLLAVAGTVRGERWGAGGLRSVGWGGGEEGGGQRAGWWCGEPRGLGAGRGGRGRGTGLWGEQGLRVLCCPPPSSPFRSTQLSRFRWVHGQATVTGVTFRTSHARQGNPCSSPSGPGRAASLGSASPQTWLSWAFS